MCWQVMLGEIITHVCVSWLPFTLNWSWSHQSCTQYNLMSMACDHFYAIHDDVIHSGVVCCYLGDTLCPINLLKSRAKWYAYFGVIV